MENKPTTLRVLEKTLQKLNLIKIEEGFKTQDDLISFLLNLFHNLKKVSHPLVRKYQT